MQTPLHFYDAHPLWLASDALVIKGWHQGSIMLHVQQTNHKLGLQWKTKNIDFETVTSSSVAFLVWILHSLLFSFTSLFSNITNFYEEKTTVPRNESPTNIKLFHDLLKTSTADHYVNLNTYKHLFKCPAESHY